MKPDLTAKMKHNHYKLNKKRQMNCYRINLGRAMFFLDDQNVQVYRIYRIMNLDA